MVLLSHPDVRAVDERERLRDYAHMARVAVAKGGPLRCMRPGCTVTDERVLDIDHIANNGNVERKYLSRNKLIRGLATGKIDPEPYQLLCRNCNYLKYVEALERGEYRAPGRPSKVTRDQIVATLHLSIRQAALVIGVSSPTVLRNRLKYGLDTTPQLVVD